MTLLLHAFATNAAKYGALSNTTALEIICARSDDVFVLTWTDRGGPRVERAGTTEGFGSALLKKAAEGYLGGGVAQDWRPQSLVIRATIACHRLAD